MAGTEQAKFCPNKGHFYAAMSYLIWQTGEIDSWSVHPIQSAPCTKKGCFINLQIQLLDLCSTFYTMYMVFIVNLLYKTLRLHTYQLDRLNISRLVLEDCYILAYTKEVTFNSIVG